MKWLLKLYPPAWRRRYGQELAEILATQRTSPSTMIDLIAGAIDAWVYPQSSTSEASGSSGGKSMIAKTMQLRCVGQGPTISYGDVGKSLAVMLGGTLALTFAWLWANRLYADNPSIDPYIDSLASMAWLVPVLASLRYTSLKAWSLRVQAVFVLGMSAILLAIAVVTTWLRML